MEVCLSASVLSCSTVYSVGPLRHRWGRHAPQIAHLEKQEPPLQREIVLIHSDCFNQNTQSSVSAIGV